MATVDSLINQAGGADLVAAGCGVTPDATRKWRDAEAIPSRHWVWFAKKLNLPLDAIAAASKPRRKAAA